MFRRLKQNIKEKTGRATTTKYTPEQDTAMKYVEDSKKCVEDIQKALDHMGQRWKGGGLTPTEEIGDPANVLSAKLPKGKYGHALRALYENQTELGRLERRAHEELLKTTEGVFKAWLKTESQNARKITSELKTRRVDKDAYTSAYNQKQTADRQTQMEQATANFEEQLGVFDAEAANFPNYQQNHARAIKTLAETLAKHFDQCSQIAKKGVEKAK